MPAPAPPPTWQVAGAKTPPRVAADGGGAPRAPRPPRRDAGGGGGGAPGGAAAADVAALKDAIMSTRGGEAAITALLKGAGFVPRPQLFTSILHACKARADADRAAAVFAAMRAIGIAPNTYTFSALISALVAGGKARLPAAEAAFNEMDALAASDPACAPNVITYSSLISACERCGEPASSLAWFERMVAAGLPGDRITFSVAFAAAAAVDGDAVMRVADSMHAAGVAAPSEVYARGVDRLGAAGRWGDALELFLGMQLGGGVEPGRSTVLALARALEKGGTAAARSAASLFDALRANLYRRTDAGLIGGALAAVAATNPWPVAAAALQRARAAGVPPEGAAAATVAAAARRGGADAAMLSELDAAAKIEPAGPPTRAPAATAVAAA
jgi:pentatricopeptide repeat protein